MTEPTITIELTAREARVLANLAALWGGALEEAVPHAAPDGCDLFPLITAGMKLETAMIIAGVAE